MKKQKLKVDFIEGRFEMTNYDIGKAFKLAGLLGGLGGLAEFGWPIGGSVRLPLT